MASGFWANQQRKDAQRAKTATLIASFNSQISTANALKIQGQYQLALEQLTQSDSTMAETIPEKQKAALDSISSLYKQVGVFVAKGDSLLATELEEDLNLALESYNRASEISPDNYINNKIDDLRKSIDEKI